MSNRTLKFMFMVWDTILYNLEGIYINGWYVLKKEEKREKLNEHVRGYG